MPEAHPLWRAVLLETQVAYYSTACAVPRQEVHLRLLYLQGKSKRGCDCLSTAHGLAESGGKVWPCSGVVLRTTVLQTWFRGSVGAQETGQALADVLDIGMHSTESMLLGCALWSVKPLSPSTSLAPTRLVSRLRYCSTFCFWSARPAIALKSVIRKVPVPGPLDGAPGVQQGDGRLTGTRGSLRQIHSGALDVQHCNVGPSDRGPHE